MKTTTANHGLSTALSALAGLFEYPGADFAERLEAVQAALRGTPGPAEQLLARFAAEMGGILSPEAREELYTGTFDVTPACVAYVSIHLFGEENFKRGAFMAALNARYQEAGFNPGGELPDHLSNLLRYAAQTDETERRELIEFCLLGPLGKMLAALKPENPYHALLAAVRALLQESFPGLQAAPSPLEQMRQHGAECGTPSSNCNCASEASRGLSLSPRRGEGQGEGWTDDTKLTGYASEIQKYTLRKSALTP